MSDLTLRTTNVGAGVTASLVQLTGGVDYRLAVEREPRERRWDEATLGDVLVHLGWARVEPRLYSRRLSTDQSEADLTMTFDRFTAALPRIIDQRVGTQTVEWMPALEDFCERVHDSELRWWLYGSAALAVRGLAVSPQDLDLHVDDARLTEDLLRDVLIEPMTRMQGWVADLTGRAWIGCIVEWLAGAYASGLQPPHEQEDAAEPDLEEVVWRGYRVRVPSLALSLATARRRGLVDRVILIESALA